MAMEFTDLNFQQEVLSSKEPVLVDFWASWCGPCKQLGPVIDELANEYNGKPVKIGKLEVDNNPTIPGQYQVMSVPTLILFKGGEPMEQLMGVQTKQRLQELLNKIVGN